MPVVSAISSKGGCGKSTALLLIADRAVAAGLDVTIIDSDPTNYWAIFQGQMIDRPANLNFITCHDANKLFSEAKEAATRSQLVLIDTKGAVDELSLTAAYLSDLVLVPLKCGRKDWVEAIRTYERLINPPTEYSKLAVAYERIRFMWSEVDTVITSKVDALIRKEVEGSKFPFLATNVLKRAPFKAADAHYKLLEQLKPDEATGVDTAIGIAHSLLMEVMGVLSLIDATVNKATYTKSAKIEELSNV